MQLDKPPELGPGSAVVRTDFLLQKIHMYLLFFSHKWKILCFFKHPFPST